MKKTLLAILLTLALCMGMFAYAEPTEPSTPPETTTPSESTAPTDPDPTKAPDPDPTEAPDKESCEHVWKHEVLEEATCTKEGVVEHRCTKCDKHYAEKLEKTAHKYVYTVLEDGGCEGVTIKEGICSVCGAHDPNVQPEVGPGHKWVDAPEIPATCTSTGKTAGTKCERCGEYRDGGKEIPMAPHKYVVTNTIPATYTEEGLRTYTCSVCGDTYDEPIAKKRRPAASTTDGEQPVAEDVPALPYGSIVSDVTRADETYAAQIVEEGENHVLVITADPDEAGAYALRNLHITDELLAKMAADHIEIVRFVVGTATVEFPVASFTGDMMAAVKAGLTSPAKEYIITVDPTATTAEGNPGCSVSASIACEDGSEFDITGVVEGLTVTMNGVAQAVTEAAVYAA